MDMLAWDVSHEQRVMRGGFLAMRCGTGGIVTARNEVAARFLERDAEWLLWVDTDMGFTADTADRLLAAADPTERPIVGALCFAQHEYATDGMGGFRTRPRPTLYPLGRDRRAPAGLHRVGGLPARGARAGRRDRLSVHPDPR